eukprot:TRINITY_DN1726_c0_g1_i3.p2 TRINITY_DN1726_c0_g1~~TRINITY_DN1726_c0_g1_i3.p2  ORF type:complete len:150 (-),score=38.99 TRINITY_DN1726_c0_g1_i3:90-539(-)
MLVVVMKHKVEEFKTACRTKKYTVRKYDPSQSVSDEEVSKLSAKFEKAQRILARWTLTNFGEAYYMWVHLTCIQVFVESVLRFGLPADFEAMIVVPKKHHEDNLKKILVQNYSSFGRDFADDDVDDGDHTEKFYPFVFSEVTIDFGIGQ